jgi:hypothetical protein
MFRKTKELQSLVNASRKSLDNAERKIEDYNILLKNMEEQAKVQYEEKKQLEKEIANKNDLIRKVRWLLRINKYNNENAILDKIKELVTEHQSNN